MPSNEESSLIRREASHNSARDYWRALLGAVVVCTMILAVVFMKIFREGSLETNTAANILKPSDSISSFSISSPAFSSGAPIPSIYTHDGADISPPLQWTGVPEGTKSLALIVDDPDAPDPAAPKMTWVHWVLYNIPPTTKGLPEGISSLPQGTLEGKNDWKKTGYRGPKPPIGVHRYFFKLYALDKVLLDMEAKAAKASVVKAMKGHILGQTEVMGTYKKGGNSSL